MLLLRQLSHRQMPRQWSIVASSPSPLPSHSLPLSPSQVLPPWLPFSPSMAAGLASLCVADLAAAHWPLNGRGADTRAPKRAVQLVCSLHAVMRKEEGVRMRKGGGVRMRSKAAGRPSDTLRAMDRGHDASTKPAEADIGRAIVARL